MGKRWLKLGAALLWLAIAGVTLWAVVLFIIQPYIEEKQALQELHQFGVVMFTDDSLRFVRQNLDQKSFDRVGILLRRIKPTSFDLYLDDCELSDLSPLAGLGGLKAVRVLNAVQVSDLRPLAGHAQLQRLDLDGTGVSDVGPLAALTNLQVLSLNRTGVSDVGPLAALTNLQELYLNGTVVQTEPVEALRTKLPNCLIVSQPSR